MLTRFTSRKFLMALSAVAGLLAAKQHVEAAATAIAYILGEAHIDAKDVTRVTAAASELADSVAAKV